MNFVRFTATQLRQPAGFFGRHLLLPLLNRVNVPINTLALEVLRLSSEDRVLEVGFGGGDLMARMARVVVSGQVTGVDFSRDAVEVCSKRFQKLINAGIMDLHCASVEELPFAALRSFIVKGGLKAREAKGAAGPLRKDGDWNGLLVFGR